jgi:predicted enzyme related to lactoylglutathione lyase
VGEHEVVWWEIESPDPDRTQNFYRDLFGWEFRRAFDEPNSELQRRYWIIERAGDGIGGL